MRRSAAFLLVLGLLSGFALATAPEVIEPTSMYLSGYYAFSSTGDDSMLSISGLTLEFEGYGVDDPAIVNYDTSVITEFTLYRDGQATGDQLTDIVTRSWSVDDETNKTVAELQIKLEAHILTPGAYNATWKYKGQLQASETCTVNPKAEHEVKASAGLGRINDKHIAFPAYYSGGENYIKLRDIAAMLNGTEKQFDIEYRQQTRSTHLIPQQSYTPVGGEFSAIYDPNNDEPSPYPTPDWNIVQLTLGRYSLATLYVEDTPHQLYAYNIGGHQYVRIYDLANILNLKLQASDDFRQVLIDTTEAEGAQ